MRAMVIEPVEMNPGVGDGEPAGAGVALWAVPGKVVTAGVEVAPVVDDPVAALPEQPEAITATSRPARPRPVARETGPRRSLAEPGPGHVKVRAV